MTKDGLRLPDTRLFPPCIAVLVLGSLVFLALAVASWFATGIWYQSVVAGAFASLGATFFVSEKMGRRDGRRRENAQVQTIIRDALDDEALGKAISTWRGRDFL